MILSKMAKIYYQSFSHFIACNEFFVFVNEIQDIVGFGMNCNLSLVSISLVDASIS